MLTAIPSNEELQSLIGSSLYGVWSKLNSMIEEKYSTEHIWSSGGKNWIYEYKYRRGGKTLCSLYIKESCIGFMVIMGKAEREKFENARHNFSEEIQRVYDEAKTYHDGKWMMFLPKDETMLNELIMMLEIKRKPNKNPAKNLL